MMSKLPHVTHSQHERTIDINAHLCLSASVGMCVQNATAQIVHLVSRAVCPISTTSKQVSK